MQTLIGTVVSLKMPQTAKIVVVRRWTHPLYRKTVSRKKNYLVHSEIALKEGERVVFVACRPVSKNKKWKVLKKI